MTTSTPKREKIQLKATVSQQLTANVGYVRKLLETALLNAVEAEKYMMENEQSTACHHIKDIEVAIGHAKILVNASLYLSLWER